MQNKLAPVLPSGLNHLLKAFESDSITYPQLVKIIADFPSITARLLCLANSAWASPSIPVENLEAACLKLGIDLVRNLSVSICIESSFSGLNKCKEFKSNYFWCSSLLTVQAVGLLASYTLKPADFNASTLQTAGLLHNMGLLWLADNCPEQTAQALRLAAEDESLSTLQALRRVVGIDYCEVGGMLGRSWNLPETLISAMEQHNSELYPYSDYPSTVLIGYAVELVSAVQHGKLERPEISIQASVNFKPTDLDNIYTILQDKFFEIQELAQSMFSV